MSNITKPQNSIKNFLNSESVIKKFNEVLGQRATSFVTSVLQITSQNQLLAQAEPSSVYQAAMMAATLDLPINANLGFAYIIPYKQRAKGNQPEKVVAQFQLGYKGFIQLAQRSGQFKTISATPIYEGQLVEQNPLTGFEFNFSARTSDKVIGYAAYFQLLNGFEKTLYMSVKELTEHGTRFSQSFKSGYGLWKDDFDSMAIKTVLKLLLSKFAPLSVDMQKAVISDQSSINDADTIDGTYVDAVEPETTSKEEERLLLLIDDCVTVAELIKFKDEVTPAISDHYETKFAELAEKEVA